MLQQEGDITELRRTNCSQTTGKGLGGALTEGVQLRVLRLRTALHTMEFSPQNRFSESHAYILVWHKALRELLSHIMTSVLYPFIQFLRTN